MPQMVSDRENDHERNKPSQKTGKPGAEDRLLGLFALGLPVLRREVNLIGFFNVSH